MSPTEVVYLARHPQCRHVRAAKIVDESKKADVADAAKEVGRWMRVGLLTERTTDVEVVRKEMGWCVVCDANERRKAEKPTQAGLFE